MTDSFYDALSAEDKEACRRDICVYGTYIIKIIDGEAKRIPPEEFYKDKPDSTVEEVG